MHNTFNIKTGARLLLGLALWISPLSFCFAQRTIRVTVVSVTYKEVNLSWPSVLAEAYLVERKEDNFGQNFVTIATLGGKGGTNTYQDRTVVPNTNYRYRIRGIYDKGSDVLSPEIAVTIPIAPPSAPSGLTATTEGTQSIRLSWSDANGAEASYVLERSSDGGGTYAAIANVPYSRTPSYTDNGLKPQTRYCYRVKARNSSGDSGYSNAACTATEQGSPNAPTSLIAGANQVFQIQLNWIDRSDNETSFEIERRSEDGTFARIATTGANVTQFLDGPLTPGTRYYYRVRAVNGTGASGYTNEANAVTAQSPPAAPRALSAVTAGSRQINLIWQDQANNEDAFEIERSTDGSNFTKIADAGANTTSFQSTGLAPNTRYWYRVRARNSGGLSAYSNVAEATTRDEAPQTPGPISGNAVSNTQINLSWADNSGNETGFELESSGNGTNFAKIADLGPNTTSYQHTGLTTLTRYWYRIRAKNAVGNSAYSNVVQITTLDVPPAAPTGLAAVAVSSSQINLTWKDNSGNETGFEIERSTDGKNFVKTGDAGANAVAFQQSGLAPATRYWFRVRSRNSRGGSSYSNIADATTRDVPPANPAGLSATAISYQQISLKWTDQSGNETGFEIERSTDGKTFQKIVSVAANVTSYQNTGLTELTQYYYRVRAVNAIGSSGYSEIASAKTPKAPLPDQPKNLTAVPIDFDLIQLKWSPVSTNTTTVVIERSQYPDREFKEIGRQQAAVTQFPDHEILPVRDYYYRIKATNPAGSSPYSNVAKISAGDIITGLENADPASLVYASDNKLYVRIGSPDAADLALFDKRGIKRLTFSVTDRSEILLSGLEPGIYFVMLRTSRKLSRHKILVK
ncbi:hypothetical protein GCM10023091_27850 [Ravibacter arvi]|uniref:Fibronectin type-III domain-containing protein n=1 Tax=Ravibacter arvi TaxID=2051041 RepID=A0ABP8M0N9_9BACT